MMVPMHKNATIRTPRTQAPYPAEQQARDMDVLRTIARRHHPAGHFERFTDARVSNTSMQIDLALHPTAKEFLDYMTATHGKRDGFTWGMRAITAVLDELAAEASSGEGPVAGLCSQP